MTQTNRVPVLDLWDLQRLALDCEVCFRTLQRAISGQPVKAISLRRIRRVLAERGLLELLPERS
jgi:hypothetical protein